MDPVSAYKETSIKTASQGKLIILMYDGVIKELDNAIRLLDKGSRQLDKINSSIVKAQSLITELSASLDFEKGGKIAGSLFSLYIYFNQQLSLANIGKESAELKSVKAMMTELRGAWSRIVGHSNAGVPSRSVSGVDVAG